MRREVECPPHDHRVALVVDAILAPAVEAKTGACVRRDVTSQQADQVVTARPRGGSVVRAQRTALPSRLRPAGESYGPPGSRVHSGRWVTHPAWAALAPLQGLQAVLDQVIGVMRCTGGREIVALRKIAAAGDDERGLLTGFDSFGDEGEAEGFCHLA